MSSVRVRGFPVCERKSGASGGAGCATNMDLMAVTGQDVLLGAAATRTVTPLRKGSVLDAGRVSCKCVTLSKLGRKMIALRERLTAGFHLSAFPTVNSPHRRNAANARQQAAVSMRWSRVCASAIWCNMIRRIGRVMGSLGLRSFSPWYRLMPRMRR